MTSFLLIRHAATGFIDRALAGRMSGVSLTSSGREQARRLARRLSESEIGAIYSSPQERARETAALLAAAVPAPVRIAREIDEIDYGDWTGRSFDDLAQVSEWQAFNRLRSCARVPNGESMVEVQARVVRFLQELCGRHLQQSVALVSHADVIRALLAYCLATPLDLMLRFAVDPCSVSIVRIDAQGPLVMCINRGEPDESSG